MMSTKRSLPGTVFSLRGELAEDGGAVIATPETFPESALTRIREIADSHPEIEVEIAGGLAEEIEQSGAFLQQETEKAEVEFEARSKAAQFAVANTVIEGGHVLPETEELMNEWARGEIDDDELIEQGLKRFGPGA